MAENLIVYGLAVVMLGIVVWWAFDAWGAVKRRRRASSTPDETEQTPPPVRG